MIKISLYLVQSLPDKRIVPMLIYQRPAGQCRFTHLSIGHQDTKKRTPDEVSVFFKNALRLICSCGALLSIAFCVYALQFFCVFSF